MIALLFVVNCDRQEEGKGRAVYFVEDKWQNATYQKFCVEGIRKELWKV